MIDNNSSRHETTLMECLLDATRNYGGGKVVLEDIKRRPLTYRKLLTNVIVLGRVLSNKTKVDSNVGILLPGSVAAVVVFFALLCYRRIPTMFNFTHGRLGMVLAGETAQVQIVITSREFVEKAALRDDINYLSKTVEVLYLEDIAKYCGLKEKLYGWIQSHLERLIRKLPWNSVEHQDPAVVLFTSGSEGSPKGVVLSHENILSNIRQINRRIDFNSDDVVLTTLPMFHAFSLTCGTIMPLMIGGKTFIYPSPLDYRKIAVLSNEVDATVMFGSNTYLAGYVRAAQPNHFRSMRYVFSGAEELKEEVRDHWVKKFGIEVLEGYGTTETSPVLALNKPDSNKPGTVGKLLPEIAYNLEQIPGLNNGALLHVKGPNIMLGYLYHNNPGIMVSPRSKYGARWHNTGDIVNIDAEGYVSICGRAKRYANIAGELVSLAIVESLASKLWPTTRHAAISIDDGSKGERIILLTENIDADHSALVRQATLEGVSAMYIPKEVIIVDAIPVLGTGKTDYSNAKNMVVKVKWGKLDGSRYATFKGQY